MGFYSLVRAFGRNIILYAGEYYFKPFINYMCMCFPYQVGVQAGLFDQDDIEKELEKPQMTKDKLYGEI